MTENKTQKNISSHAYDLSNHVSIMVNYTLSGKYKAIVRSNAQFIAIIITGRAYLYGCFVLQCCQVSGIVTVLTDNKIFNVEVISADSLLVTLCIFRVPSVDFRDYRSTV